MDVVDRLEKLLEKHESPSIQDAWSGNLRRSMASVGVMQGPDGLPIIHIDKQGKTTMGVRQESFVLRFEALNLLHTNLKVECSGLRSDNAELRLEIERLKHGDIVTGYVFDVVPPVQTKFFPNGS